MLISKIVATRESTNLAGIVRTMNSYVREARDFGFRGAFLTQKDLRRILKASEAARRFELPRCELYYTGIFGDYAILAFMHTPPRLNKKNKALQRLRVRFLSRLDRERARGRSEMALYFSKSDLLQGLDKAGMSVFSNSLFYEAHFQWSGHGLVTPLALGSVQTFTPLGDFSLAEVYSEPVFARRLGLPLIHTHMECKMKPPHNCFHSLGDLIHLAREVVQGRSKFSVVFSSDGTRAVFELLYMPEASAQVVLGHSNAEMRLTGWRMEFPIGGNTVNL